MKKKYSHVDVVHFYVNDIVTTSVETEFVPFPTSSGIKIKTSNPNYSSYELSDEGQNYNLGNPYNVD